MLARAPLSQAEAVVLLPPGMAAAVGHSAHGVPPPLAPVPTLDGQLLPGFPTHLHHGQELLPPHTPEDPEWHLLSQWQAGTRVGVSQSFRENSHTPPFQVQYVLTPSRDAHTHTRAGEP